MVCVGITLFVHHVFIPKTIVKRYNITVKMPIVIGFEFS